MKTKFGLDAKSSEYIYKHHITRLEDIYTNHKTHNQNVPGLLYMSPVSQLYGMNGKDSVLLVLNYRTLTLYIFSRLKR